MTKTQLITARQLGILKTIVASIEKQPPAPQVLFFAEEMVGRALDNLADITRPEWEAIRDKAFPHWESGDWTLAASYRTWLGVVLEKYKASIGQLPLWDDDA